MKPLFKVSKEGNFLAEADKNATSLVCEECGTEAPKLYSCDVFLYCVNCAEAHLRRERFKREEDEWNNG